MPSSTHPFVEPADRDLELRVALFLAGRHVPALRRLSVEARQGTVVLRGQVRSYHEKQISQAARRVAGVRRLIDDIEVSSSPHGDRQAAGAFLSSHPGAGPA